MDNSVGRVVESFRGQILFKSHNIQDLSFLFVKISKEVLKIWQIYQVPQKIKVMCNDRKNGPKVR